MLLETFANKQYKEELKDFKLVFGNKEHIQIAKLMGDINERETKLKEIEEHNKRAVKLQEELTSLQGKVIYLIREYGK